MAHTRGYEKALGGRIRTAAPTLGREGRVLADVISHNLFTGRPLAVSDEEAETLARSLRRAGHVATSKQWMTFFEGRPMRARNPGKFEGAGDLGEELYEAIGDSSFLDEELGDVEGFGWYGLMVNFEAEAEGRTVHVIVHEDSQGFFDYEEYDTAAQARRAWKKLEREYEKFEEEAGDDAY